MNQITCNCLPGFRSTIVAIGQLGKRAVTWIKSQFDGLNARIREFSIRFFTEVKRTIIGRENYEVKLKLHAWVNDPSTKGMKAEAANRIFEAYRSKSPNLDLRDTNLNSLPTVIGDLTQLRTLHLGYNNLTTLPAELGDLTNLNGLDLRENNLTTLPTEIGNLTELQALYLSHNNLTTLPTEIGNLTNLNGLDLRENNLTTLPAEIGNLTNLHILNLRENSLTTLPAEIGNLTNLDTLSLYQNNLTTLPLEIGNLTDLHTLALSRNNLTTLPAEIGNLTNLRTLVLSRNNLTTLPLEIGNLTELQALSLHHNNLTTLPGVERLHNLIDLSVENNPNLVDLPPSLGTVRSLINFQADERLRPQVDAILNATRALRDANIAQGLPALLQAWTSYSGLTSCNFDFVSELDNFEKCTIAEWLRRLEGAKEFRKNRVELAQKACGMLETVGTNPNFAAFYFNNADANNSRCEDRASMAFNVLYTMWCIETLDPSATIGDKIKILKAAARTHALRNAIAARITKELSGESVEVYLYYESTLADELGLLTAIGTMNYEQFGKRAGFDMDALKKDVEANYIAILLDFVDSMGIAINDTNFKAKLDKLDKKFWNKMDKLQKRIGEGDEYQKAYRNESVRCGEKRKVLIQKWVLAHINTVT